MPYTELPPRPYSKIRGGEPSVTTIIGLHAIPGLPWAAARETAQHAVEAPETWQQLDNSEAIDYLRRHHRGIWDGRAAMGTALHTVMQRWVEGHIADLDLIVRDMATNERQAKSWAGHEEWAISMLTSYSNGLATWFRDFKPADPVAEVCVRTPGLYVGTRDLRATIGGEVWDLDVKTTSELDSEKGLYHDSWALQLAAYRYAEQQVTYGLDAKGKVIEVSAKANEPSDHCGVIHLRGDHSYTFYEVAADEAAYRAFDHLARFGQWVKGLPLPKAVTHADV